MTGISPDATKDEKSGQRFFKVTITVKPTEKARLDKKQLRPGLPAEVFIKGQKRRVITYLIQPLIDQLGRTFREE